MNVTDLEREQIAEQIIQGCEEGILDDESGNRTHWTLNLDKFKQ